MHNRRFYIYVLASSIILMSILPLISIYAGAFNGAPTLMLMFFWLIYPVFMAVTGMYSGKDTQKRWMTPFIPILIFTISWRFLFKGELSWALILIHTAVYFIIGYMAMGLGRFIFERFINNSR